MRPIAWTEVRGNHRKDSRSRGEWLKTAVAGLGLLSAVVLGGGRAGAASRVAPAVPVTHGNAYGEQLSLKLQTLLATVQASSGPLSVVTGDGSPFYKDASALSVNVGLGPYGTVLHTGLLLSHTDSSSPGQVSSNATVHDLGISLVPVAPLLTLHADEVRSSAAIGGACGSALTATGSTTLVNAGAGGTLGLGLHVGASVPPNTVLLDLLGVRVVLNEQVTGGDGVTSRSIGVNAIHVSVQNALLSPLGRLTGDIVIAHSEASVVCPPTGAADLSLLKQASADRVSVGAQVTYTLTAANAGPDDAARVVVTDPLPAGATFVSAASSQGDCTGTDTVTCALGTLAAGAEATVTITVQTQGSGELVNQATVSSATADPDLSNNTASASVLVLPQALRPR